MTDENLLAQTFDAFRRWLRAPWLDSRTRLDEALDAYQERTGNSTHRIAVDRFDHEVARHFRTDLTGIDKPSPREAFLQDTADMWRDGGKRLAEKMKEAGKTDDDDVDPRERLAQQTHDLYRRAGRGAA